MSEDSAKEAPLDQREWLRVTLSSIGDAVITTDTKGCVTFLNPVAESLTGWKLEQASGVPLDAAFKIVNEETRRIVENPAARALQEGLVVGLANHTLLIAKDGTERPIDDSAAPIRNANGTVAGVVLVFRDVTERRNAEKALKDSEERFRLLVDGTEEYAIFMLDPQGKVVSWNPGAERIKGYRAEEIIGKHFSCFYPKDIVEIGWPERELQTAIAQGRFEDEGWRVRKDGSTFWADVIITALRDETGKLKGFSKITRDLTDRKRAEAALKDSEVRYRRLFETATDGILVLESDTGKIIDANPCVSELLGYSHNVLVGKKLWQLGLFRDTKTNQAAFQHLQEQGQLRLDHLLLQTSGGQTVEVELVGNVVKVDSQSVIQCNIRDVTASRQLERIQMQAEMLADLNRRKDEFLAMLSHELRNPLSAILTSVELLRLQKDDEHIQQQATAIIERHVGHLKHLLDDLLDVSRITSGAIKLRLEQFDLRDVVQSAMQTVRHLIDERKHELDVSLPPEPIWLHADPVRIEQVVVNLLVNAAKYTDDGGQIRLQIEKQGKEAVLRVQDTGVGIAPELLPRIFDPFTQADRSLDRTHGGLGVGLTVVQKVVELHGGKVEAHSGGLGKGSEFIVRLPVALPAIQRPAAPVEPVEKSADILRVLVVDDNKDAADTIAMLLQLAGHDVRVAYSGKTAIQTALAYQPDIVLLDLGLPEMDGYAVAERLRQIPQLMQLRLIALSGYGQETDRQRSHQVGFDEHLLKPVDQQKLHEVLANLSKHRRR